MLEAGDKAHDAARQSSDWGETHRVPERHPPLDLWRRRMLGGSSSIWGGRCLPYTPSEMTDWGAPWPVSYDEYAPYLSRATEFLELGENDFDARTALPPEDREFLGGLSHDDLSIDDLERYSPPTNVAERYWSEVVSAENITVLLNAPCIEIRLDEAGQRADRAIIAPAPQKRCTVRAKTFVIAGGGLETARLLLASSADRVNGLGNEHDHVGRYYMTHLVGNLGRLATDRSVSRRELAFVRTTDGIYTRRNFQPSAAAREREGLGAFVLRPTVGRIDDPSHGDGVLSALFLVRFMLKNELYANMARRSADSRGMASLMLYLRHAANVALRSPSVLSFAHKWYVVRRRTYRKVPGYEFRRRDLSYPLEFNAEQAPNPASRVRLGNATDSLGMRRLAVEWKSSGEDVRTVRRGFELVRDALATSDRASILSSEEELEAASTDLWPAGGHHIGTARMSAEASKGVVDRDLKVWSVDGLYVAGSAVFPRSGAANPTLASVAFALRLADHLASPASAL
ncbi:MAG: GMC oxidoreductase [Pseudomonadota bacterium]